MKWLECVYDILTKPAYDYFTREGKNWNYTEKGLKEVTVLQAAMPPVNGEEAEQVVTTIIPTAGGQASSFISDSNAVATPTPQPKRKKKSKSSQSEEERMFGYIEKYLKMKGIVLPQTIPPEPQPALHPVNPTTDETSGTQPTYYQSNQHTMTTTSSDTLLTTPPHSSRPIDIDSPKYMCVEALGLLEGSDTTVSTRRHSIRENYRTPLVFLACPLST